MEGELITTVLEEALISPTKLNAPLILVEPVIVWFPTNIFKPVVANTEEAVPFNNLEFKAQDAVIANDEVPNKDPVNEPVTEPVI